NTGPGSIGGAGCVHPDLDQRWTPRLPHALHNGRPGESRNVTAPVRQGIIGVAMSQDDESQDAQTASLVALSLEAVIIAVTDERPRLLLSSANHPHPAIPSGPLDVEHDITLERGLRRWVKSLTGFELGYVEQLYTFGGRDRRLQGGRPLLTLAYLALMHEEQPSPGTAWVDYYDLLPWEDHRGGRPPCLEGVILPRLKDWAGPNDPR